MSEADTGPGPDTKHVESPPFPVGERVWVSVDDLKAHPRNDEIYVTTNLGDLPDRMERDGFDEDFDLIIKPDGTVVSGHRRWRSAKKVHISTVPADVREFESGNEELGKLLRANDYRDKTPAEIVNEGDAWREYYENDKSVSLHSDQKYDDLVAEELSVGQSTYSRGRKVKEIATGERSAPEHVQQVAEEQWEKMQLSVHEDEAQSFNGAYTEVQQAEREYEEEQERQQLKLQRAADYRDADDDIETYYADFRVALREFEDESFDHIVTDPPYGEDAIEESWEPLAECAARVLKPGGYLIAYSGKYHLPAVIEALDEHLEYYWQCILFHEGPGAKFFARKMRTNYKPILLFTKPPVEEQEDFISDVIEGGGREKDDHDWQQAEEEAAELIDRFTNINDRILDPMCGSGTVGVACQRLDRRCVLIDEDPEAIEKARRRCGDDS